MGVRIGGGCETEAPGKGFPVQIGAGAKAAGLVDPGGFQAVGKFLFPSFRFFLYMAALRLSESKALFP